MGPGHRHQRERTRFAAIAVIWLWVFKAQAQAPTQPELALAWQTVAGCPDAAWAETRIADQLGRAISATQNTPLKARVEIVAQATGFRLTLTLAESSTRVIDDALCADLAEAATLMIALAIDESAQASAEPVPTPQAPPPKPATDDERVPALTPKGTAQPVAQGMGEPGFRVQLAGLTELGFLPKPGLGALLLFGYQGRRVGVYGGAEGFLPRATEGARRVRVTLWSGSLAGCFGALMQPRLQVLGCVGAELGRVRAEGVGLTENLRANSLFAALTGRLALKLRMAGPIWVSLEPGLAVPLIRQRFVTFDTTEQSTRTLHTPRPVSGRASLGIELHF